MFYKFSFDTAKHFLYDFQLWASDINYVTCFNVGN